MDKNKDSNYNQIRSRQVEKPDQKHLDPMEIDEVGILRRLLNKIWGVTEILQNDLQYIKQIYTKPILPKKSRIDREERKMIIKHKLLTRNKKTS